MTLPEYTNLLPTESFCNWIESKVSEVGSIWGNSSYKFGIYMFKGTPTENPKYRHDDTYAWFARYGVDTAEEAFKLVKAAVIEVAEAGARHDLEAIEKVDIISDLFKWKVAFLYSGEWIVPVFNKNWLRELCAYYGKSVSKKASMASLQKLLIEQRGSADTFEFQDQLISIYNELAQQKSAKVWLYAPGREASEWSNCLADGTMCLGWAEIGDLTRFGSQEEIADEMREINNRPEANFPNDSLALWEFCREMQPGDIVYAKKGLYKIIGRGIVEGNYEYDPGHGSYPNVRKVKWTHAGEWDAPRQQVQKTLTNISDYKDCIAEIEQLFTQPPKEECRYWWLVGKPKIFRFADMPLGGTVEWTMYTESGTKRRVFQNFLDAKVGDKVFCYQATPTLQIVALGEISRENNGTTIQVRKVENLLNPIDYAEIKDDEALSDMEFVVNPNGSLFKVTPEEAAELLELIRADNPVVVPTVANVYDKDNFLEEVFLPSGEYDRLCRLLYAKKNIILQGAPGVGKTFTAKRLAYSLLGEKNDTRVEVVQFHQNYSYEDFFMGYKPDDKGGFELRKGVFYTFCDRARNDREHDYFFIIDEINRGNLSKIFGELLMLIEKGYRNTEIRISNRGDMFSVPENLYIIGMMNTADRSLALIDYALRRRFSFFEMNPAYDSDGFKVLQAKVANEKFNALVEAVKHLNNVISDDASLGPGFCIGHSYFCDPEDDIEAWLRNIVDYDIDPMLREYWFDNREKYTAEMNNIRAALK